MCRWVQSVRGVAFAAVSITLIVSAGGCGRAAPAVKAGAKSFGVGAAGGAGAAAGKDAYQEGKKAVAGDADKNK